MSIAVYETPQEARPVRAFLYLAVDTCLPLALPPVYPRMYPRLEIETGGYKQ